VLEKLLDLPQPDWSLLEAEHEGWKTRQQLERENERLRSSLGHAKTHLRARDLMLEGTHAQLVVQDIHLHKTQRALHNKEHWRKNDRALLFDGQAQVLSSDEFRAKLQGMKDKSTAEEARKTKSAAIREAGRAVRAEVEEKWKEIQAQQAKDLEEWKQECQRLAEDGVPKKNWPKAPKRQKKPEAPTNAQIAIRLAAAEDNAEGLPEGHGDDDEIDEDSV
jgi:hypothetical protein